VGAALLKYDCSFSELADFFAEQAPADYRACVDETRDLVQSNAEETNVECIGADASGEAIRFAGDAELIEDGIAKNLEETDELSLREAMLLRGCHLMTSTGAIGYVGPRTLEKILELLGKDLQLPHGPYIVVTILRMFDPKPIVDVFSQAGYSFVRISGVRLRQRHFDGQRELIETLELLQARGIDAQGWEAEGYLYADLFVGAPERDVEELRRCLQHMHAELNPGERVAAVG
jgi:carnitine O-acetyltransferase